MLAKRIIPDDPPASGDQPRYRLVELHRKRIENGERSVLVGLQSFAQIGVFS
jgi:hypothetical protein